MPEAIVVQRQQPVLQQLSGASTGFGASGALAGASQHPVGQHSSQQPVSQQPVSQHGSSQQLTAQHSGGQHGQHDAGAAAEPLIDAHSIQGRKVVKR
jgi:hypothetical protein